MKTIFMTSGGGAETISAAMSLWKDYRIILGDMDPWAAGLRFAHKFYVLPAGDDEVFIDCVSDIIRDEKVDVFVPFCEQELLKSHQLKDRFPDLFLLTPEYEFTEMCLDKWSLIKTLTKNDIPCPKTILAKNFYARELSFPLIIKPRLGRGSKNTMTINSLVQINAYKSLTGIASEEILLQEKIEGMEFTVSVVVNKNGKVLAVVPKECIKKNGMSFFAVTRESDSIHTLCVDIAEKLHPNGPFNVQLIRREDGELFVFEINPRFSSSSPLTIASGVSEVRMLIEQSDTFVPFKKNLVMMRYHEQVYEYDKK